MLPPQSQTLLRILLILKGFFSMLTTESRILPKALNDIREYGSIGCRFLVQDYSIFDCYLTLGFLGFASHRESHYSQPGI